MRKNSTFQRLALWLSVLCFVAGLGYIVIRYRGVDTYAPGVVSGLFVFGLIWGWSYAVCRRIREGGAKWTLIMAVLSVPCATLLGEALNRHIWRNLVALESLESEWPRYVCWDERGRTMLAPNTLELVHFHRRGDETAHLAAALAIRQSWVNPWAIAKLIGVSEGHNRSYWLRRALTGHPPGLAMLYAPVATNPPLARIWAALIFAACGMMAFWAGNQWSPNTRFGLLTASAFLAIPNVGWWHAFSVSSDIPPALFTFAAFGLVGRSLSSNRIEHGLLSQVAAAGLLLGIGCFVTLTASLAAFALAVLVLSTRQREAILAAAWLLIPSALCVILGVTYSKLAVPAGLPGVIARLAALTQETTHYTPPLEGLLTFVRRWPMDLGIVITVLFATLPVFMLGSSDDNRPSLPKAGKLAAALSVLIPAAMLFWPEIRFAFPGILVVFLGLGFQDFWEKVSPGIRDFTVANVVAFGGAKFILHNLLVV